MMKQTIRKALSLLMAATMVTNMGLTLVFAEDAPPEISERTKCHTKHDADCGYKEVENAGCTHEHDNSCGYDPAMDGAACTHTHNDDCDYSESVTVTTPCTQL